MTDLAALGLSIDSSQAVKAAGDLDKMTASAGRSEKGVADAVRRATDALNNLSSGMAGYSSTIAKALEQAQRPVQQAVRSFGDLRASLDPLYASSRRYASVMDEVAAAVQRGEASQDDANRVMALAERRYLGVADAIEEQRRAVSDLRASLDPLYASSKRYEAAQEQLTAAVRAGVVTQDEANRVLTMAQQRYLAPVSPMQRLAAAQAATSGSSNQLTSAITNASFQVQDFAVQVASGQAATTALAQQLPQLLGAFGMAGKIALFGSILGTLVAVGAAVIPKIDGVSKAVGDMMNSMDEATGVITGVKDGLSFLGDNIDRIVVYTATGAAGWAAYTAAMALANAGTITLAGSLTFLRGAMMRTGILAIVVAAGELVYQFARLVKGAGGFGEAMGLLGDLGVEVFHRMGEGGRGLYNILKGAGQGIAASFTSAFALIGRAWDALVNGMAGAWNGIAGTAFGETIGMGQMGQSSVGSSLTAMTEGLVDSAVTSIQTGGSQLKEAMRPLENIGPLMDAVSKADSLFGLPNLKKSLDDAGGSAGKAAKQLDDMQKAADRWRERIEQVGPPMEKYQRDMAELTKLHKAGLLSTQEVARAQRLVNDEFADGVPLIGDLADAWGNFVVGGLRDFKGFVSDILGSFKSMISEMIATAARNRIVLGITGGVGGLGGTAAAAAGIDGGGLGLGNLMSGANWISKLTGFGSSVMSGITAPLQAALSSATSGGLMQGFQTWNASLNGMASGMNGLGAQIGAYLGPAIAGTAIGGLIAGDYKVAGLSGSKTSMIGSGLGMLIGGPIGGLIGGALGGVANRLFGKKLTGQGIGVRFDGESSDGYSYQKYKGGLLSSGGTKERGIGSDMEQVIADAYGELRHSVTGMAETLGIATGALDVFNYSFRFSTKGLSGEEITERLNEELAGVGDAMSELLLKTTSYTKAGEAAGDTLSRLATSLTGINSIMDTLGHGFRAAGLAGADLASDLADLFGGLDAMGTATQAYYNAFYSEEQRRTTLQRQMTEQLGKLGIIMPRTRQSYIDLIEAQDLTTVRGQEVYAALIQMAQGMDSVLPAVRTFTTEIANLAGAVTTELQAAISGAQEAAQGYAQSARLWYQTAQSLRDFIHDLNNSNLAYINPQQALAGNQSRFDTLLGLVKGGDVEAAKSITGVASDLLTSLRQTSRTQAEYATAAARVTAGLNLAAGISDLEGANDDILKTLYEQQIGVLTQLQNFLSYQGLTEEAIKQLPKDLQAMVRGFDGTLAQFDQTTGAIEAAIKEVTSFSYAALQERLNVNVDLIAKADVPDYIRGMLDAANDGIRSSIDFIVRKDLPPDMKWIAITGQSTMIKDIQALVSGKSSASAIDLALKTMSARQVAVTAVLASGMSDSQKRLLDILGNGKGTLTLGGSFQFDPTKSFSVWYENTTKSSITNPMGDLRSAIYALRAEIVRQREQSAEEAKLTSAQNALNALSGSRSAAVTTLQGYTDTIHALEASTGATLVRADGYNAKTLVRADGSLGYNATRVVGSSAAVKAFNATGYWANGGMEDQLYAAADAIKAIDAQMEAAREAVRSLGGVPQFANGGFHTGGLRLVGERGPELEATGPARIYTSGQTRDMLGNGQAAAETKALREENRQLQMAMNQNLRKMAKVLEKWDRIGQPPEQEATGTAA